MERKFTFTDETRERAMKLFESDTEMLHEYGGGLRCVHCNVRQVMVAGFDDECPALLRCALNIVGEKARAAIPQSLFKLAILL